MSEVTDRPPPLVEHGRRGDSAGRRRRAPLLRALSATGIAVVIMGWAVLVSVGPTTALLALAMILVTTLAFVAPAFGLVGAILVVGFEGVIKIGLAREWAGAGVTGDELGAALIDITLFIGALGVAWRDRCRTLLVIWRQAGRLPRLALCLLAFWLLLSLVQMNQTGDLGTAVAGYRLSQAYVLAVLAGAMLLARSRPEPVLAALVAVLLVVSAYAGFRGIAGPSESERLAAFARATTPLVPSASGVIFRNTGSFSSAIALASFLVPAGVFLFALGLFRQRLRLAAWVGVALVLVALLDTYVRASLVAISVGTVVTATVAMVTTGVLGHRAKAVLALAAVPLLVGLIAVGAVAPNAVSSGSEEVATRGEGVFKPGSDASLSVRFDRWRDTLRIVRDNPFGTGVGTVGRATLDDESNTVTFTDDSYLKVLQEQGPLGAVPFTLGALAALVAAAAGAARRIGPERGIGLAAIGGSLSFFVLAATSETIEQPGKVLAWLLLGIALWAAFGTSDSGVTRARRAG